MFSVSVSLSLSLSYLSYLSGINTFGLLNVISFFVIIGIGVDDILVFINTFKQSSRLAGLNTVHKRIAHTIIEASKATFFTSITTSVAFFANAISSVCIRIIVPSTVNLENFVVKIFHSRWQLRKLNLRKCMQIINVDMVWGLHYEKVST